jgi:hypothetical protein
MSDDFQDDPHKESLASQQARLAGQTGVKIVGDFLKKAATLGAGVYVSAEDAVNKTLNTVQVPPKMIREAVEGFFNEYTIVIQAEVKLKKKNEKSKESDSGHSEAASASVSAMPEEDASLK